MKTKSSLKIIQTKHLIWAALVLVTACGGRPEQQLYVSEGFTMGTYYRVSIVGEPGLQIDQLKQEIDDEFENVNQSMSTYLKTSEISQFNRTAGGQGFELSEPVAAVVRKAIAISRLSQGAFDITVGPLVRLWGFDADGTIERMPDKQALNQAKASVGQSNLSLRGRTLEKKYAATEINLSAIAKGSAIDRVAILLLKQGLDNWLIDVGGELRAAGENIDRSWQVAIETPSITGGIQQIVELKNRAIATSGDYRNFVLLDGEAYSHAIDPATGHPVRHSLASASVLHDSAETADALATALLILGKEKALELADTQNLSVFLICREGAQGEFNITKTGEFTSTSH